MKVAFLDRDGVINVDTGYTHTKADFTFTHDCIPGLLLLQRLGYEIIIVTNQSGIGRGYYTEADYHALTQWYLEQLQSHNISILDVFHCPHHPDDGCDCRKPKAGLFKRAQAKYPINIERSLMIGDNLSDIQAANAAGIDCCYLLADIDKAGLQCRSMSSVLECAEDLTDNNKGYVDV